jgi:hypothetical protein
MPLSRREFLGGCLATAALPSISFGRDETLEEKIKKVADKYSELYGAPGIVVSMAQKGKTVASYACGLRDIQRLNDIKVTDQVGVGSISKPVCGYIVTRLVEQDLLKWDTPFSKVCPDLCKDLESPAANATLAQLMTHTAGLTYFVPGEDQIARAESKSEARQILCRLSLIAPGVGKPGEKEEYAGGANFAAVMAEYVTDKTYEDLIKQYINEELGLGTIRNGMEKFNEGTNSVPRGHYMSPDKHEFVDYGDYSIWGKNLTFACEATMALTGSPEELARLMSVAAGCGTNKDASALYRASHEARFPISTFTLGSWSKTSQGIFHYGSTGEGEWSSIYLLDSTRTATFIYMNCNSEDNSFRGTEMVNELNKIAAEIG